MILNRFDNLIEEGEAILKNAENISLDSKYIQDNYRNNESGTGNNRFNWSDYVEWRTKSATLLCYVLPRDSVHDPTARYFPSLKASSGNMISAISFLKAIKSDLECGFFDDLVTRIEGSIAIDYMEQAEQLLENGHSGQYDHVPAAVLSGAVLEKTLRKLCTEQQPEIAIVTINGEQKTLNPLIDDLKKSGLFNEVKAKQLRSWADIRNKAAHGEFDQFKRSDVEQMIQGVRNFLGDYLA